MPMLFAGKVLSKLPLVRSLFQVIIIMIFSIIIALCSTKLVLLVCAIVIYHVIFRVGITFPNSWKLYGTESDLKCSNIHIAIFQKGTDQYGMRSDH